MKTTNSKGKLARMLLAPLLAAALLLIPLVVTPPSALGKTRWVVTFYDPGSGWHKVYAFVPPPPQEEYSERRLYSARTSIFGYIWSDHQKPGTGVGPAPGVITYRVENQQKIYAFVREERATGARLFVKHGNPSQPVSQWSNWVNLDKPTSINGAKYSPAVVVDPPEQIYAFVGSDDGRLFMRSGSGGQDPGQWPAWVDLGTPNGAKVADAPGVITFRKEQQPAPHLNPRRIYVFVRDDNGQLFVKHGDGGQWSSWVGLGTPQQAKRLIQAPGVVTFRTGLGSQKIYAFVVDSLGRLFVKYGDDTQDPSQWPWAPLGKPPGNGKELISSPGVVSYQLGVQSERICAFVVGENGSVFMKCGSSDEDPTEWASWEEHDPPEGKEAAAPYSPGVVAYRVSTPSQSLSTPMKQLRIHAFVRGVDNHLHMLEWGGSKWTWVDVGQPPEQ